MFAKSIRWFRLILVGALFVAEKSESSIESILKIGFHS